MREILIKVKYNDDGYEGHGDDTAELIIDSLKSYLEIDLEGDDVIKPGWSVELVDTKKD